jgi:RNA recognition motif-containing protein
LETLRDLSLGITQQLFSSRQFVRFFVNIYVGNLAYRVTDEQLRSAFSQFGKVSKASVIMDRVNNRSKGFGFVEMDDSTEGKSAVDALNGNEIDGRAWKVNEAKPREKSRW